jgi:glyoxylase-like metal-dependent hydrolase (beta-lactamase superfamily II)
MNPRPDKHELGRGERVLPGLWRLRLPLSWPGVPHVNAYAIAAGDGIVLVDCGVHDADSMEQLQYSLRQAGLRIEQVRQLVITHAHVDHWGQAAAVAAASGCEVWLHPNHRHGTFATSEPSAARTRMVEIGRQSGVPAKLLQQVLSAATVPSFMGPLPSRWNDLLPGIEIETDLGTFAVYETPGHAPSHVCLHEPAHRLLVSGDHLMGRVSHYYDYGYTPDPVGEFLSSLALVDELDARLCVSGHGKPFNDVHAHVEGNRTLVQQRLASVMAGLAAPAPNHAGWAAAELIPGVFGAQLTVAAAGWWVQEMLVLLGHLELQGRIVRAEEDSVKRWRIA